VIPPSVRLTTWALSCRPLASPPVTCASMVTARVGQLQRRVTPYHGSRTLHAHYVRPSQRNLARSMVGKETASREGLASRAVPLESCIEVVGEPWGTHFRWTDGFTRNFQ
jgi:hypothetical protein